MRYAKSGAFVSKIPVSQSAFSRPESSSIVDDVMTKLLMRENERENLDVGIGLPFCWWNKRLLEHFRGLYDDVYRLRKLSMQLSSEFTGQGSRVLEPELTDEEEKRLRYLEVKLSKIGMENPLSRKMSFFKLSVPKRVRLLLYLCEAVAEDPFNE